MRVIGWIPEKHRVKTGDARRRRAVPTFQHRRGQAARRPYVPASGAATLLTHLSIGWVALQARRDTANASQHQVGHTAGAPEAGLTKVASCVRWWPK